MIKDRIVRVLTAGCVHVSCGLRRDASEPKGKYYLLGDETLRLRYGRIGTRGGLFLDGEFDDKTPHVI